MWARRNGAKYGATRVSHAGRSFASKLEAKLFDYLTLLERAGEIRELKCQTQVHLSAAAIIYKPDFTFFDVKRNEQVWAESKGFETPEWRIKRRLWMAYGPGLLQVFRGNARGVFLHEELAGGAALVTEGQKNQPEPIVSG